MKIRLTHRQCPGCEESIAVNPDGTFKDHKTPLGHDCIGEKWRRPVGPGPVEGRIRLAVEMSADEALFVIDALELVVDCGGKLATRELDLLRNLRTGLNAATGLVER